MKQRLVKKVIDWSLYALTIAYLLTGLGITQYRAIERLTLGLLSKSLSFNIHEYMLIPFLIFLTAHILFRSFTRILLRLKGKI